MKIFWPHRSQARGFSIENFARKYREKIPSVSYRKNSHQILDNSNLKSFEEDIRHLRIDNLSMKKGHWANRDFSEYREAS
tara:strand:+ start:434 stop:673 length:240 start_codon:yes stop_codon:yes gene_type:complete